MTSDKEEVQEELENKKEVKPPFWQTIPPWMLLAGGILIFFALQSMDMGEGEGNSNTYLLLVVVVIVIWFMSSKQPVEQEQILLPKQARIYIERELELLRQWKVIPLMTKYKIGFFYDLCHRDTRGKYYNFSVTLDSPYALDVNVIAKVMARGIEKGIVTFIKHVGEYDGRETPQQKDLATMPDWIKRSDSSETLKNLWGR